MAKISVAIATYNEEQNIRACLDSVRSWVDEIVVVDGESTDKTVEIAKRYKAKVIASDNPPIFHINKQKAVDTCTGDWIFQLDADEVVTLELANEIQEIVSNTRHSTLDTRRNGHYVPRKNFFLGHWLRKGGQYPDYVIRLFRRGKGKFPSKSVHEQIEIDGNVGYLKNPLLHYTSRTLGDYWKKARAYTSLEAQEFKQSELALNIFTYVEYNLLKPTMTLLSLFLRHKGFLDGIYGFLFSLFSALHHPIAFWKNATMQK